jgi:D-glycero-alpha-D-manno-heptose 1-phosphate guanylyltransferase
VSITNRDEHHPAPPSHQPNLKAVLLVGGMGTRLRPVIQSVPKSLAPIGNRSFLELLVRQLAHQDIRRLIMCTGYRADQIEKEFGNGSCCDVEIEYSRELQPLGTGGAIKLAQRYLTGLPYFLVLNGDSFLDIDFNRLIETHRSHHGLATIAAIFVDNASRYGTLLTGSQNRILEFCEKTGDSSPGLISAGVYVFSLLLFDHIPSGSVSVEKEVFPKILCHGVYAMKQEGMFIDIGTPDDYWRAQQLFGHTLETPRSKG